MTVQQNRPSRARGVELPPDFPVSKLIQGAMGVVALIVVAILIFGGSSHPYQLRFLVANADGLTQGSPVNIGGVPVGATKLGLQGDKVLVTLNIDKKFGPVGKDAKVAVVDQNLLGQKQVEISVGNRSDAAQTGYLVPAGNVTLDTDLQEVLNVADPSTRARLQVLINELGVSLTGRGLDIQQLLDTAPGALGQADQILMQLNSNDSALSDLLTQSNRFVTTLNHNSAGLEDTVNQVGQTAQTVATRRVALRQTLANAPAAFISARNLLAKIEKTTPSLGEAATQLTKTAAPLKQTLQDIAPFTDEAKPALNEAETVAPSLVSLSQRVTPVLKQAKPVLSQLDSFTSNTLPGTWSTLGGSIDNILSVVQNWSRAIQFRDGMSHIFRGEASIAPNTITSELMRLEGLGGGSSTPTKTPTKTPTTKNPVTQVAGTVTGATQGIVTKTGSGLSQTVSGLGSTIQKTVSGVTGTVSGLTSGLTSGLSKTLSGGASGHTSTTSTGTTTNSQEGALLNYLLGK